jgi:dCTP deaminase
LQPQLRRYWSDPISVITGKGIRKLIDEGNLVISPFDKSQIGAGSIDLHLGREFRVFKPSGKTIEVGDSPDYKSISKLVRLRKGGEITIMPGEFLNGITEENIKLPPGCSGRIEGRSRFARIGLLVHVSSGFVQPGTDGKIVLEIVNLSPFKMKLKCGTQICQLIIEEAKGGGAYKGRYYGQKSP